MISFANVSHRWRDPRIGLLLILLATLAQGVLRASVVPAWFNFDEPGHMEYVLYVTENQRLPAEHDIDFDLRQRMSAEFLGKDCSDDVPGQIRGCLNFHQFQEQPLYYLIQATFQWVFGPTTLTSQLRLARLISVLLHLGVVLTAWHTMQLIFPDKPLTWAAVSGGVAILPGMVNMMSSVNNDVMAALAGALLIYTTVALIMRGFSIVRLIFFVLACTLTAFSKTTAAILIPAALFGGWLILRFKRAWLYIAPLALSILTLPILLDSSNSAAWITADSVSPNRAQDVDAPDGSYVFHLAPEAHLVQYLALKDVAALRGETATVSALVRAGNGLITLDDSITLHEIPFTSGEAWSVVEAEILVAPHADYLAVTLEATEEIQIDAVRLLHTGSSNLLHNGSAEQGWLLLRSEIDRRIPYKFNERLQYLYSWQFFGRYYPESLSAIFISFWGSFGWGAAMFQMPFTGVLGVLTAAGILCLLVLFWRYRKTLATVSSRAVFVLFIFTTLSLFFTFIRTDPPQLDLTTHQFAGFVTSARYFYPVVTATMGLLMVSWSTFVPQSAQRWLLALFLSGLYIAHMLSLFTVQMSTFVY